MPRPTEDDIQKWLADLASADYRERTRAARCLGNSRDLRAVEPLILALKDRTIPVREAAAVALGRLKDPRAVPALVLALADPNYHAGHAARHALIKIGEASVEPVRAVAVDPGAQPSVRLEAVRVMQRIATPLCLDTIFETYDSLADNRDPEYMTLRLFLLETISRLPDNQALLALLPALETGEAHVRHFVMSLLGARGDPGAFNALVAWLRKGDLQAFEPLRKLGYPGLADDLAAQIIAGGPSDTVLLPFYLAFLGDERARQPIARLLRHSNISVRRAAAEAMEQLDWARHPDGKLKPSVMLLRHLVGQSVF